MTQHLDLQPVGLVTLLRGEEASDRLARRCRISVGDQVLPRSVERRTWTV